MPSNLYNQGCIKIFKFIDLLYNDKAYYKDVLKILTDNDTSDDDKNRVLLYKYLNALKIFGLDVEKSQNKFIIKRTLFPINFDNNDIKSIKLLEKITNIIPSDKNKINLSNFVDILKLHFDENTQNIYEKLNIENNFEEFFDNNLKEQTELCEKYCSEDYRLNIKYTKDNVEYRAICNAIQVIYDKNQAYLRVYFQNKNELEDINIANILSLEQTPALKSNIDISTTVVYLLKGRVAKSYVLKDNETLDAVNSDGSIVIINKNEPLDKLLTRLIRYENYCEILKPEFLRKRMTDTINNALQNYL